MALDRNQIPRLFRERRLTIPAQPDLRHLHLELAILPIQVAQQHKHSKDLPRTQVRPCRPQHPQPLQEVSLQFHSQPIRAIPPAVPHRQVPSQRPILIARQQAVLRQRELRHPLPTAPLQAALHRRELLLQPIPTALLQAVLHRQ